MRQGEQGIQGEQGPQGETGPQGEQGEKGDPGEGMPSGGTTGQMLVKATDADYDTEWVDPPEFDALKDYVREMSPVAEVSGSIVSVDDAAPLDAEGLVVDIEPVQDLNGYDAPWPAGGGKNLVDVASPQTITAQTELARISTSEQTQFTASATIANNASINSALNIYAYNGNTLVLSKQTVVPASASSARYSVTIDLSSVEYTNLRIVISGASSGYNLTVSDVQFEKGSTATSYAPYSNICPISGWTGATVQRTGVNLLDESIAQTDANYRYFNVPLGESNLLYMSLTDKDTSVNVSDCYLGFTDTNISGASRSYRWVLQNGTVYTNHFNEAASGDVGKLCGLVFVYPNTEEAWNRLNQRFYISVNYPATDTEYHAYQGTTLPITFPSSAGTVYGGTLDVTNGVLTVDRAMFTFTGAESFVENTSAWGAYAKLHHTGVEIQSSYVNPNTICSHFSRSTGAGWGSLVPGLFMTAGGTYVGIGFDGSISDLKEYLADQYSNNQPVQVVAFLATPITYQLTPQQVALLRENNNVWADTGDTTLTYRQDVSILLSKLTAQVAALNSAVTNS